MQKVVLAHGIDADIFPAWLINCHPQGVNIINTIKHLQHAQAVAHQLGIAAVFLRLRADQNTKPILEVNDLRRAIGKDNAVRYAGPVLYPAGEIHFLLHQNLRVAAGLAGLFVFLHDESRVSVSAVPHLLVVVVQVFGGVGCLPAQLLFH